MNLIQIQERLKDLPTQAVMSYANGQNPQVPPYLALGELNRRKQMEQQSAQAPTGTVKENIEQQVGLMQLQKARQGQMAQQSSMQGANAPMIPQGTPEPQEQPDAEMAMAAGGITRLPTQDMEFGSGGIIAFKKGDAVKDKDKEKEERSLADQIPGQDYVAPPSTGEMPGELERNISNTLAAMPGATAAKGFQGGARGVMALLGGLFGNDGQPKAQNVQAIAPSVPASVSEAQATALAGPQAAVPPRNMAPPPAPPRPMQVQQPVAPVVQAAPAAPVQSDSDKYLAGILAGAQKPELPKPFEMPKQAPIGEDYLKYVADREAKRKTDEEKFKQRESGRSQRDFFNSLIAAGEATRGQKGIGSLFGGFGKAYSQSATEAEDRQTAFENAMQEKADLDAKMKFEISNLRRAEDRGDAKGAYDSKIEIAKIQQQQQANAITAATSISGTESRERTAAADITSREKIAEADRKARTALHGMPSYEQQQANKFIDSWKTANPGKPFHEAFTAYRAASSGSGERQDLNELKALQGNLQKQTENFTLPEDQRKTAAQQLVAVNAKISQMAGIGSIAPKTATMADVKTTAAKSGRTEQQVIDAMKANGYTIQ
jgi:hypothetical protein